MVGWEFPPFMSGGLGVHCLHLTRALASHGIEIDFYLPKNSCSRTHTQARFIQVYYDAEQSSMHENTERLNPYLGVGFETSVIESEKTVEKHWRTPLKKLKKVDAYNIRLAKKIIEKHETQEYDLIHAQGNYVTEGTWLAGRKTKTPVVWTVHSTIFDQCGETRPDERLLSIERFAARTADKIIAVSKHTQRTVVRKLGAKKSKVSVVYNAVEAKQFENRARHDNSRHPVVLFHGRITAQKGPKYFLLAAKKILEKNKRVRFVMSGKGDLRNQMIEFAHELKIKRFFDFPGFVPNSKLAELYAGAEVFVCPSISEPFGITVLEAMAAGTPTLVSKTSGVSEVAKNIVAVDYWDVDGIASKITSLINNPRERRRLSERGLEEVKTITWDGVAEKTIKAYESVLNHSRD
ncbi:MAG: glycosyltransferase family 4 protein [Candidatus Micrarchaeota archaeon]